MPISIELQRLSILSTVKHIKKLAYTALAPQHPRTD